MSGKDDSTFLGKDGKVFGPFPPSELERLRASGALDEYTYVWDPEKERWRNLDPEPPKPGASTWSDVEAVAFNEEGIVKGRIENVTDEGCDLLTRDAGEAPRLGETAPLVLNLVHGSGDKAMNVKATLTGVTRQDGLWVFRIRWAQRPSL